jgi:probable rRNA maturation factor
MNIEIYNQSITPMPEEDIVAYTSKAVSVLKKMGVDFPSAKSEITIALIDEKQGQQLNHQFRGKNYPTDVLSFAPTEPDSLGELALCSAVVDRQAKEHGITLLEESVYLVIHGILHLLGYEHENDPEGEAEMMRIQDAVFEELFP